MALTVLQSDGRISQRSADNYFLERILKELQGHPQAWPFLKPVNGDEVLDYYDVIKNPMGKNPRNHLTHLPQVWSLDFNTMEHKLETNQYKTVDAFVADAQLVFDNCRSYNPENTIYSRNATKLEKFLKDQLLDRAKREGWNSISITPLSRQDDLCYISKCPNNDITARKLNPAQPAQLQTESISYLSALQDLRTTRSCHTSRIKKLLTRRFRGELRLCGVCDVHNKSMNQTQFDSTLSDSYTIYNLRR